MPDDAFASGHLERELSYYRRECNDLGARLLRQQEEQSQAFREARRSRTVVKLLREAYRLGDVSTSGADVGGPMLEIVVDNAMCDRAALLREEPLGSGVFVASHLIGLSPGLARQAFSVRSPPAFAYTSAHGASGLAADDIQAVMGVPYILWAYDRPSGIALVVGNRSEGNINRPFEAGDQELIEGALSVYLDVIYRKQAEAQLRLAKQAAELASETRSALLDTLAVELRMPLQAMVQMFARAQRDIADPKMAADLGAGMAEVAEAADHLLRLLDDAAREADGQDATPVLDVEWVPVEDLLRAAMRSNYASSVRRQVELDARPPLRRITACVDRRRMQHVLQYLISGAMRLTPEGGTVRISGERRSDGSLELLICSGGGAPASVDRLPGQADGAGPGRGTGRAPAAVQSAIRLAAQSSRDTPTHPAARTVTRVRAPDPSEHEAPPALHAMGGGLPITRRLVEAHGGALVVETTAREAIQARVTLPPSVVREAG